MSSKKMDSKLLSSIHDYLCSIASQYSDNTISTDEIISLQKEKSFLKMRNVVVSWMYEVKLAFNLNAKVYQLAAIILDVYLSRKCIPRNNYQLVGCTALLIANKYDSYIHCSIEDFRFISANTYTRDEIIEMEMDILHVLDYSIGYPIIDEFIPFFIDEETKHATRITSCIGCACFFDFEIKRYSFSIIGRSIAVLVKKNAISRTEMEDLKECMIYIIDVIKRGIIPLFVDNKDHYPEIYFLKSILEDVNIPLIIGT